MSSAPLLASELGPADPRQALFDAACDQIKAKFPRTVEHEGRTWWVRVSLGGPYGLAIVMLFASPDEANLQHAFVVQLGEEFGHAPPGCGVAR